MEDKKINYGKKTIYKNSVLSLVFKIGSSFISFFSAPLLLFVLGEEKYGAWATLLSLVSWMYYCDIGIGGSMRNRVAASIAENDYNKAKRYVSVSYAAISIISIILLLIIIIGSTLFDICGFFSINVEGENLNLCLVIAFVFACLNFIISLSNNVLYATQEAATVSFFGVLAQSFFLVTIFVYSITGINALIWVAAGEGICQLVKNVIQHFYTYKKYPRLKASFEDIDWSYSKDIMSLGMLMFFGQIAALVLNATDNLVISRYISVASVTPYNLCYKYFNIINMVYVSLITPLLSAYTMAYAKKDKQWIKRTLKKNAFLFSFFFVGLIAAMFIFEDFARIWLRKELDYERGLIAMVVLYFILLMFNHIWSTFLSGVARIKESTIAVSIGTLLNIPVSIFLAANVGLGTTGVIIGSIISLLPSTIICPIITLKMVKKI